MNQQQIEQRISEIDQMLEILYEIRIELQRRKQELENELYKAMNHE